MKWLLISLMASALSSIGVASPNKTLIYCSETSPIGFDPNSAYNTPDYTAAATTLYNRLVEYERGGMEKIGPSLSESWEISKDGRVYTFYLRHGVKFHTTPYFTPKRELNADDVIFTFERMRNPQMPFRKAYPTEFIDFHDASLDKVISKIEALDPYTVQFTLNTIHAPFLSILAMPFASIISAEYATQLLAAGKPSDINWKPVGTGPFIFQEYIKDATIRFKGNPEYWNPDDVQLSKLIFSITPDAAVRTQKLIKNECQVISYPRPSDIATLGAHPNLQVLSQPGFNLIYLAYNVTHKPLDNVLVRRALDMVINKKAIIDAVYEDRAQIAVAPMPPSQWGYDASLKDTPRDLEQAKKLLAQAGYPKGFTISLSITSTQRPYNPNARLMAEIIQRDLDKIGVKTKIVTYELSEYYKRATNGEHDALLIGSAYNRDPDEWFRNNIKFSKWRNSAFNDLIQRAVQITDITQRTRLYLQAQKIFKREQPFTPIAYATDYQAVNKNVRGFKINPLGPTIFSGVSLSSD